MNLEEKIKELENKYENILEILDKNNVVFNNFLNMIESLKYSIKSLVLK